ncbi:hypothetical protein BJ917_2618 [Pseudomonas sp. WPR_5_2]|uniref:hypothetical protein n=1 Tax=Pseudomonas sp. WPR_5_2 TaxID=1907371 RepID=UPI000EAED475|nr:hypothetical protein [Pseudomonas sp. WPR_5_2]RKS23560.1 hypothetical protein BJ917_2618 [Pseudomonas sp. WPR_5_2]
MQTQHLIIITACLVMGLFLMAYYVQKMISQAFDRHYAAGIRDQKRELAGRIATLHIDVSTLTKLRNTEARQLADLREQMHAIKATPFTKSDHQVMLDITRTLALALQTWKAMPGTEPTQAKAELLINLARGMAHRVFYVVESASNLNADPLDTQLIDWLNKRGDLYADIEQSAISFPHVPESEGYTHLRDALREAYEMDIKRQATELGQSSAEEAA